MKATIKVRCVSVGDYMGAPIDMLIYEPKDQSFWPGVELVIHGDEPDPKPCGSLKLSNCTGFTLVQLYHGALPLAVDAAAAACVFADLIDGSDKMRILLEGEAAAWRTKQGLPPCVHHKTGVTCDAPCEMAGCLRRVG